MAHPSARLTVFSRQLLIKRVIVEGWPTATVAEQLGISRATAYKLGPPLPDGRPAWTRGPQLATPSLAATIVR